MEEILRTIYYDINSTEVTLANSVFKLVLSMVLGVLVGVERKRKGQIAGVRTFALISMGACMAMLLSIYVPQVYLGLKNGDPGRIAAQDIEAYREVFNRHKVHLSTYFIEYDYERDSTQLNFVVLAPSHRNYLPMFQDLRVLGRTKSLTLTSQA